MFEELRDALRALRTGGIRPDDRRALLSEMRSTLTQARVGLDDLRQSLATTRTRLAAEQRELDTVRRRKALAAGINDHDTVEVATRFEAQHAQRVAVLQQKLDAQQAELAISEREVEEMTAELKLAAAGGDIPGSAPGAMPRDPMATGQSAEQIHDELDALERARRRAAAETDAEAKLAALKRRMEK
jgi:hypothetical protein